MTIGEVFADLDLTASRPFDNLRLKKVIIMLTPAAMLVLVAPFAAAQQNQG